MSLYLTLSSLFGGLLYYYHNYFKSDSLSLLYKKEFFLENKDSFVELNLENSGEYLISVQYENDEEMSKEYFEIINPKRDSIFIRTDNSIFYIYDSKLSFDGNSCFGVVRVYKLN